MTVMKLTVRRVLHVTVSIDALISCSHRARLFANHINQSIKRFDAATRPYQSPESFTVRF
jgi:hypothetical protein